MAEKQSSNAVIIAVAVLGLIGAGSVLLCCGGGVYFVRARNAAEFARQQEQAARNLERTLAEEQKRVESTTVLLDVQRLEAGDLAGAFDENVLTAVEPRSGYVEAWVGDAFFNLRPSSRYEQMSAVMKAVSKEHGDIPVIVVEAKNEKWFGLFNPGGKLEFGDLRINDGVPVMLPE